ncbi:AIPR family protein [Cetobacterium sp.]|uniref:AIPR family protein n=1 Tax=Cetobacterium sp. TaxID=2071632 RepID=UPI003F2C3736
MITIEDYYESFMQKILSLSGATDQRTTTTFFDIVCESLAESGDISPDFTVSNYQKVGMEISGWDYDPTREILSLFVCEQFVTETIETLTKSTVETKLKRVQTFYQKSLEKLYEDLEETSEAGKLSFLIFDLFNKNQIKKVKLVLLTNGKLTKNLNQLEPIKDNNLLIEKYIVDIDYLYKTELSNYIDQDIDIDVNIPCLIVDNAEEYNSYLAVIDGETICNIYGKLGQKVLSENVRTFLQFKGGVNKGIRNTIENKQEYFFAYNNGITATATDVELNKDKTKITKIKNLQIVNGGQTTSSIYRSKLDLKKDVSSIYVQMKLSIIKNLEKYPEFVQNISRYANTQNKVNESDFFSNHEFHKDFSLHSKRVWAPIKTGGTKKTLWFYERVRGEYLNESKNVGTLAKKRAFEIDNPKKQVIDKVFLAKSENLWNLNPVDVCKGAQYSFKKFAEDTVKIYEKNNDFITETYFKNAIARAIIFKRLERLISDSEWYDGGYRAQTVAYTIAYLSKYLSDNQLKFNFQLIWEMQSLDDFLDDFFRKLSYQIYRLIMKPDLGYTNIGEWCKKNACWDIIKNSNLNINLKKVYLVSKEEDKEIIKRDKKVGKENKNIDYLVAIFEIENDIWLKIYEHHKKYNEITERDIKLLEKAATKTEEDFWVPSNKDSRTLYTLYKNAKAEGIL